MSEMAGKIMERLQLYWGHLDINTQGDILRIASTAAKENGYIEKKKTEAFKKHTFHFPYNDATRDQENHLWKTPEALRKHNEEEVMYANQEAQSYDAYGVITLAQWLALVEHYYTDKYKHCLRCRKINRIMHLSHILPLRYGGKNTLENIQPLCTVCRDQIMSEDMFKRDYRPDKGQYAKELQAVGMVEEALKDTTVGEKYS